MAGSSSSPATPSPPSDFPLADSQDQSATDSANRPISTNVADSQNEARTPLAESATDYTDYTQPQPNVADSPEATQSASTAPPSDTPLADSPNVPQKDQSTASASASLADSRTPPSAESPNQPAPAEQPSTPVASTPEPSTPSTSSPPSNPPEPVSGGSIQDLPTSNQPSQVQPEPQEAAPSPQPSEEPKPASESAEIKPEAPEGTQNAPLAESEAEKPAKTTFGDLVTQAPTPTTPSPIPPPPPIPPITPSPPPASSFGDFLQKDTPEEPVIHIESIEPKPPPAPSVTSSPPPISPITPRSPSQPEPVLEAKADYSSKRQQALQVRRKRREEHLSKILSLVSQKGKINNKQIRDLLRVSQSTATNYLHSLVKDGKLKKQGKGKAIKYFL